jgi:hypothetical protein
MAKKKGKRKKLTKAEAARRKAARSRKFFAQKKAEARAAKRGKTKSPRRSAKRASAKSSPRKKRGKRKAGKRKGSKSGSRSSSRSRSSHRSNTRIEKQLVIKHVPTGGVRVEGHRKRRTKKRGKRKSGKRKGGTRRKGAHRRSGGGRRKGAMENPMSGVELFVGSIFGLVGFMAGDAVDRALATHALTVNPVAGTNGTVRYIDTPPTTGDYQGLFNATAVCAPMDAKRWIVGVVGAAVPLTIAHFVSAPTGRAALQFFGFAYGVRIVGKGLIDLTAKLLVNNGTGQRLYDGEMVSALLKGNSGAKTGPAGNFADFPAVGMGKAIGAGSPDCAPCAEKNGIGYPSMPRGESTSPATQVAPPPPPPPPPPVASGPPTFRAAPPPATGGLFGVPRNNGVKSPFAAWGNPDEG